MVGGQQAASLGDKKNKRGRTGEGGGGGGKAETLGTEERETEHCIKHFVENVSG